MTLYSADLSYEYAVVVSGLVAHAFSWLSDKAAAD